MKELYEGVRPCPQNKVIQDDQSEVYATEVDRVPIRIKLARLYTFIFLLRRFMIIAVIIFFDDLPYGLKISLLLIMQAIYLAFVISVRIFENYSDQI